MSLIIWQAAYTYQYVGGLGVTRRSRIGLSLIWSIFQASAFMTFASISLIKQGTYASPYSMARGPTSWGEELQTHAQGYVHRLENNLWPFFFQSDQLPQQCHLWSFLLPEALLGLSHSGATLQRPFHFSLFKTIALSFGQQPLSQCVFSRYGSIILLTCSWWLLILEMWAEPLFIKLLKIFLRALIFLFKTYI